MGNGLTLIQRAAICFAAGVVGGLAVLLADRVMFESGLSAAFGLMAPMISLKSPEIYKPLFWAGLWGIPFGLLIKTVWNWLYLFGLLYFLAPLMATFLIFLPMAGAGNFGLLMGGPKFPLYLVVINIPYGLVTALAARAIVGK